MTATEFLQLVRVALAPAVDVTQYLAAGGQAAVFRGTRLGADVVIKVFGPHENPERIIHEIEAMSDLDSPYLVKALDAGHITLAAGADVPYIVYEYLAGNNLCGMVGTKPDAATLVKIGLEIGTAIEALWEARIVHRDVKPANIIELADRFVLVDIGLAKHLDRSGVTQPHHRPGTQGYMSPEQWGGQPVSIRADIFALGVTLYEIAAGVHPFSGMQALIGKTIPTPLSDLRTDLPKPFCRFVSKMMAARSPQRPRRIVADLQAM